MFQKKKPRQMLSFLGHGRAVDEKDISTLLGIGDTIVFEGETLRYIGMISSPLLDENISQERSRFNLLGEIWKEINDKVIASVKEFLDEPIRNWRNIQKEKMETVLSNYPSLNSLVKDTEEWVSKLKLSSNKEEEIYSTLSLYKHRKDNEHREKLRKVLNTESSEVNDEDFGKQIDEAVARSTELEKTGLLEYLIHRKHIIDLLNKCLQRNVSTERHVHEAQVHKLICPMRTDSKKVEFISHNLWLVDERLAYSAFWASDLPLSNYTSSESLKRPDLVFYDSANLLSRQSAMSLIVVEFKRPSRGSYALKENPVTQIWDYVRELRNNDLEDLKGEHITRIKEQEGFSCYLIADLLQDLRKIVIDASGQELPDGGFIIRNHMLNAEIIVIPYRKLLDDAELRHKYLFDLLEREIKFVT
ncbi:MAG: hypothetical protein ACON49_03365 [Candidatus Puniceispirillaceae bacterium]